MPEEHKKQLESQLWSIANTLRGKISWQALLVSAIRQYLFRI